MTWRSAKKLREELVCASSFRLKCRCWTEWTDNQIRANLETAVNV
jgi:hypothetical protein